MATKITINGVENDMLTIQNVPVMKITEYNVKRPKLWSSNTGRDLNGTNKGTLIGVFTKIEVQVSDLTDQEYSTLSAVLDRASMSVKYYDLKTRSMKTELMYSGDMDGNLKSANTKHTRSFKFSLIGIKKRTF